MKKVVLSAIAVFALSFVNAQEGEPTLGFTKGDVFVEGNIGFNSSEDKNSQEKTNSFAVFPAVGYFISEDLALGVRLGFGSEKTETSGTTTDKNSTFAGGVFLRYHFLDLGKRLTTYANVALDFESRKEGVAENKYTGFGFGAGLGMNYFVTEKFAINFGLSNILSYESEKPKDGEAVNTFSANLNVFENFFTTAQFGMTYKF